MHLAPQRIEKNGHPIGNLLGIGAVIIVLYYVFKYIARDACDDMVDSLSFL